jgi:hypothetical protein
MKKAYSYLVSIPIVLFSLVPAIKFYIPLPRKDLWFWYVLIAGFLGVYTLFLKTNIFLKIIAVGSFINCFFSAAPYLSFTAYISLVACCYFYVLCSKIKDWKTVFEILQVILLMNIFLIFMQGINKDTLLSFGIERIVPLGIIGQSMQMGSLSVILAAILISFNPLNFILSFLVGLCTNSQWSLLCTGVGFYCYFFSKNKRIALIVLLVVILLFSVLVIKQGKLGNLNDRGRVGIWKETIRLANEKPIEGWGIGTYKHIFHPLMTYKRVKMYKTAHNDFFQVLFELGYPGLLVMISLFAWLAYSLFRAKEYLCLSGWVMIATDMQVHFPMRCIQMVPIIILFIAYCVYRLEEKKKWQAN